MRSCLLGIGTIEASIALKRSLKKRLKSHFDAVLLAYGWPDRLVIVELPIFPEPNGIPTEATFSG
jgi:hypothetical protein